MSTGNLNLCESRRTNGSVVNEQNYITNRKSDTCQNLEFSLKPTFLSVQKRLVKSAIKIDGYSFKIGTLVGIEKSSIFQRVLL